MPVLQAHRYRGYWAATNTGYQLEITLPAPPTNAEFGFAAVDIDDEFSTDSKIWAGTVGPQAVASVGTVVYTSPDVNKVLDEVVPKGSRARLFDMHGRLRADINRLYERPANPTLLDPAETNLFNAILFRLFEWIIQMRQSEQVAGHEFENNYQLTNQALTGAKSRPVVTQYITPQRDQVMGSLSTLGSPISAAQERLYLLYETNEDSANAFTSSAMVRMFTLVTLVALLVALSLFIYASWLSWRISNLSRQAKSAVSGDGRFLRAIKGSTARDEIGEMSRSFAQLVERTSGYTLYLESLSSKLSHELRTPLSVVQTSLENIQSGHFSDGDRQLLERAQGGATQLAALVRSMSEAARLEQTVLRSEHVLFDVRSWLINACAAYNDVHSTTALRCDFDNTAELSLRAVPELLQQALDKLVSNAVDFHTPETPITIMARVRNECVEISVSNIGNAISESVAQQIFEPMYSARVGQSEDSHLGLGLYIVRLIAEAHGGQVYARNYTGGHGSQNSVQVGFTVPGVQAV